MTILGIDPGLEGGLAILDGDSVILEPMPTTDAGLDVVELSRLLAHYAPQVTRAYLEMQQLRPQQQGQFTIGRNFGKLEGALIINRVPYQLVRPADWSKQYAHGVTETDHNKRTKAIKDSRRMIAQRLFPGIDLRKTERSTTAHDGLVDSLLIAHYGWNLNRQ